MCTRSFCTHQRSRLAKTTIFNTSFKQIDDSCSSHGVAARLHDKLCENSFKTHLPGLRCGAFLRYTLWNKDDMGPRINSHTTTMIVLTATAAAHIVASCVLCFSSQTLITRRRPRVPSSMSASPSASSPSLGAGTFHNVHFSKRFFLGLGRTWRYSSLFRSSTIESMSTLQSGQREKWNRLCFSFMRFPSF